ncbi:MAG TPA: hypothetical protein VGG45_04640 [Terracidiphilus sp.]|jgi:hypothetical protein
MARYASTLPFAVLEGRDPHLTITNANWEQIESAYGHQLDEQLREQIYLATLMFLALVPSELAGAPSANVMRKIQSIEAAAARLRDAILETPKTIGPQAARHADHLIGQNLRDTRINGGLRTIGSVMESVVQACRTTQSEFDNSNWCGRSKGDTWKGWICQLRCILKAKNLPIAARKDSDKSDCSSPFVRLVDKLQLLLPTTYRQSSQSRGALAKAIHAARDAKKRRSGRKKEL